MEYHCITAKIQDLLKEKDAWHETFKHESVRTSKEAADVRIGYGLDQGAKSLIVRVKIPYEGKKFLLLVMPGSQKFDKEKVLNVFGARDMRFATEPEVSDITQGVLPGGVPPFGSLFGLETFADKKLFDNKKIIFNAGDRRFSVAMFSKDYSQIEQPKIEDITL